MSESQETNRARLQRLVGESYIVTHGPGDEVFFIQPAPFRVEVSIFKQDFDGDDKQLVELILTPALNNLQDVLDSERPHHLNRYQQTVADAKKFMPGLAELRKGS